MSTVHVRADRILPAHAARAIAQGVVHAPNQQELTELVHTISHRIDVTPAKRGKGRVKQENEEKTPEQRHQAMTWAQRLKRAFKINVSV